MLLTPSNISLKSLTGRLAWLLTLLCLAVIPLPACDDEPAPTTTATTPIPPGTMPESTNTPYSCATGTTEANWLSDDFWSGADPAQVLVELDCGANVFAKAADGSTPLHFAAANSENPDVVRVLLNMGADVIETSDARGDTPLHRAAASNENPVVIRDLLYFGANVFARNDFGETPLDVAKAFDNAAGIEIIGGESAKPVGELLNLLPRESKKDVASFDEFIVAHGLKPAVFSVEGSTVVIKGYINGDFYTRFLHAVKGKEDDIETALVDSSGGLTHEGIKMGNWIFDHDVDVVVEGLCFSSCANYIFTAGKNKTIKANSLVGWHGTDEQYIYLAQGEGMPLREYRAESFKSSSDVSYSDTNLERDVLGYRINRAFFNKIGVSSDVALYGFLPTQYEHYRKNPELANSRGWTFSLEDMAKFGIDNVTYEGDGEYPPPPYDARTHEGPGPSAVIDFTLPLVVFKLQ